MTVSFNILAMRVLPSPVAIVASWDSLQTRNTQVSDVPTASQTKLTKHARVYLSDLHNWYGSK